MILLPEVIIMKRTNPLYSSPEAFLLASVLAPHMGAYSAHLQSGRYASSTIHGYILGLVHFATWMAQDKLSVELLDEIAINRFLAEHLPSLRFWDGSNADTKSASGRESSVMPMISSFAVGGRRNKPWPPCRI